VERVNRDITPQETIMKTLARNAICLLAATAAAALVTAAIAVPIAQAASQAETTAVSSVTVPGDRDAHTGGEPERRAILMVEPEARG
jgi:hypothetical protein